MKIRLLLLLFLPLMLSLSGCEEDCSTIDCIQEPFLFRIVNEQGENLLDNGTLSPDQITIGVPGEPNQTLKLAAYAPQGEAYLEAPINQNTSAYTLYIDGYTPLDLDFDLDIRSGECCTSVTIEEVYLNEVPVSKDAAGNRFITLP